MTIPIAQTIKRDTDFSRDTWNEILKKCWQKTGEFWHKHILPKHFNRSAIAEYKYQPRQGAVVYTDKKGRKRRRIAYDQRKYNIWGHRRPLEWSGELKIAVNRIRDVRSDSKGARIRLHGPTHLFAFRKDFGQPDKAKELGTISRKDERVLTAFMDKCLTKEANRKRRVVSVTKGNRGGIAAP